MDACAAPGQMQQARSTGRPVPYTDSELLARGPQPVREGAHLSEIAFPLGGIGAGCISFSGRGELVDWEIFGRPNKGYRPAYSFFTLYARADGEEATFRVLEGRLPPPYQGSLNGPQSYDGFGFGPSVEQAAGLLRMAACTFGAHFPECRVDLSDPLVPVRVSILAWSPFIPLNDADSSLPVAVFEITLTNTVERPVAGTVALGVQNITGWPEARGGLNEWKEDGACRGIALTRGEAPAGSAAGPTLALVTPDEEVTWQLRFAETQWFAATESLVDDFGSTGEFSGPRDPIAGGEEAGQVAQLGLKFRLAAGESATRTFVLAWHAPLEEHYWEAGPMASRTYAGERWTGAYAVACHIIEALPRLRRDTFRFRDAFFSSTLPAHVLEAVSSQMTTLRTPTLVRLAGGALWGWEGCMSRSGCCAGTCTHVWAYAQTLAYLFPALERGMRERELGAAVREEDGHMQFRLPLRVESGCDHGFHAAVDGQMGEVLRVYREWRICGDDDWLRRLWPAVQRALEYAWRAWDPERTGLLEGVHHNTLDIEFHGPETMCGSMYLAALRAGEQMARRLGDEAVAHAYRAVADAGRAASDRELFNGDYYIQRLPVGSEAPYQFGPGCICDQLVGQWHARMLDLGDLYDRAHMASALSSVFRYNFRDGFKDHHNPHRVFALEDERGLVICTWPRGGKPRRPVLYAHECFTGMEHEVAALLIYEGFVREGLALCRAVRDRHDGRRRNPYNEFECGSHYARALANYSYLLALSGFSYVAATRTLRLAPVVFADDFRSFFSVEGAWGLVAQRTVEGTTHVRVDVLYGDLVLEAIETAQGCLRGEALRRTESGYEGLVGR